jgi:homoserine O-acetyltransferase
VLNLKSPWRLHHGEVLERPRIAYRLIGPAGAPVVAALGGISAHRVVAGGDVSGQDAKREGWWGTVVGVGRGLDTRRYRVLGLDFVGSGDSSAPGGAGEAVPFPAVSAYDQAEALSQIVEHLRLAPLHAIVGASYGGMVALCFAARHPDLVRRIVILSATDRPQPLSTAWRSIQRHMVREAIARGDGPAGLRLARALAMTTYRSAAEFAARFAGPPLRDADRFRFPVEDYLFARGDHYVQQYRPESFLALSESIDLHSVDPGLVRTPATLIAVREDQLVPLADMQSLAARLAGKSKLVEISSLFGHDAFLKETEILKPIVESALAEQHT